MSKIIKIGQLFLNLQPIIWVDVFFLKHGVYTYTAWVKKQPLFVLLQCVHMLTDSTIFDLEYTCRLLRNMQHKSYWYAHLTHIMLLHYIIKTPIFSFSVSNFVFVLAMKILSVCSSVCPSICLSNAWFVTKRKKNCARIFIPHERAFTLVLWKEERLVEGDNFYLKFWVNRPPSEQNRRFWTDIRS